MKRSKFNLSHPHSLTCDMGYLVPCCLIDTLPNDSFYIKSKAFIRVQPMLAPIMHMINVYTQFWYVPYRLLWEEWETFITGGQSGNEDASLTFPYILAPETTGFKVGSLADYFGFPTGQPLIEVSAMPHRAMALIYNTRYRDEDLQEEIPISFESGLDVTTSRELLRPSWKKDAWTTARPWTQRGAEVSVPINQAQTSDKTLRKGSVVAVWSTSGSYNEKGFYLSGETDNSYSFSQYAQIIGVSVPKAFFDSAVFNGSTLSISGAIDRSKTSVSVNGITVTYKIVTSGFNPVGYTLKNVTSSGVINFGVVFNLGDSQVADTTEVTGNVSWSASQQSRIVCYYSSSLSGGSIAIRDLRTASAMQRYAERSAKYGNRYEEFVQREFGISPKDARIQRPEHIGSGKGNLTFSEVLQTSEGDQTQVGSMYGHGVGGINSRGIFFHAPEHGVIIGLLSVRPKSIYGQGIDRAWLKRNKLDFFLPEFAHIGMQEVFQQELMATKDNKGVVFGYQDRNYEYRSMQPKICGEFRDTLDFWNMARKFEQPPVLNSSFITMNPTKRIFGVTDQNTHSLLCMVQNDIIAKRCVPKRAVDKLL